MNPSFYVTYPSDETVKVIINAIRVIAEETQRTQVHITVRGPYKNRLSEKKIKEFSSIINGENLIVNGIGNFFNSNQNTVFYECADNFNFKKIWKKTTYKEYNPHITIYDGTDNKFAHEIFNVLNHGFAPFVYQINELSWLEPKNKEKLDLFHLKSIIDFDKISLIVGCKLDLTIITELKKEERLKYISILSKKLYESELMK